LRHKLSRLMTLLSVVGVLVASAILVFSLAASAELTDGTGTTPDSQPEVSHRFIVELQSAPLAVQYKEMVGAQSVDGKLDANSTTAQSYVAQLQAEQAAFVAQMQAALPNAKVSTYIDEQGISNQQTYQVVLNAVVVDAGFDAGIPELKTLSALPGVKAVYRDYMYHTDLYTSTHLINAPIAWDMLGGQTMAGKGIKIASMDGGLHKDAPMFDGTGWSYPPGYPAKGLGLTSNNNGKIIASRAYFRWWDPPVAGDENPWPGVNGTSHGVHTGSTAAGNLVTDAEFLGAHLPPMSGVAPGAWLMSYRVFYPSVSGDEEFHTAEGLSALEDLVKDGADVVNNSWGGGPGGIGAPFDAIDNALVNAAKAGVFVSMSNGNAGPNFGTGDHPSPDYINVAASTTSGTYAAGTFSISAPEPVSETLQNIPFGTARFGAPLVLGSVLEYPYLSAVNVGDGSNFEGCSAFPADTFKDKAAVISRGTCSFSLKVYYAQEAGAQFVVIHNHANGGNSIFSMAPGNNASLVTISSILVGNTSGLGIVGWQTENPGTAKLKLDLVAFQAGNVPDMIASFSSRGPSTRNSLKPDIAAPGVNIMAQGYTDGVSGEARHLGYGEASGTSMASPHVAGSAALLRQKYPTWSNDAIKSALMSTSKYMDIYDFDGSPAQPIDMGAGRLDIGAAMDPGVILAPPAADFGLVYTGTAKAGREIEVTNITTHTETYNISTLYTGKSFTMASSLAGVTVSPSSLSLNPGETKKVTVGFDPALGMGMDINQGYIVMQGTDHQAHLPFFARVVPMLGEADVLLMDFDISPFLDDYSNYYMRTLENLGVTYAYYDWSLADVPSFPDLMRYKALLIFTGDNYFEILSPRDSDRLNEYVQAGGKVIAMGQDAMWTGSFFGDVMGATRLQDSVSEEYLPSLPVEGHVDAPPKFFNLYLDLTGVDQAVGTVELSGLNETPPITDSVASGTADFWYDNFTGELFYDVEIEVTAPLTLTNAHIHTGTVGVSGGPIFTTFPFTESQVVTDTILWGGLVTLMPGQNADREAGRMYLNIHSSTHGGGELRGQVPSNKVQGDGASNQWWIDELSPSLGGGVWPILRYPGGNLVADGTVALALRQNPTLENPGIANLGRGVFAGFGLEGMNNPPPSSARLRGNGTSREDLLGTFLNYIMDEPTATISVTAQITTSQIAIFQINRSSNITDALGWGARWDWGDGSEYTNWAGDVVQHHYVECGEYTVRAEVDNDYGNTAIASTTVSITACEVPTTGTVTAGEGGQLRSDDGTFTVDFPAGAVGGDTTVSVGKQTEPSAAMGGLSFAGNSISISAKDANGNPVTTFARPFTLVVKYNDSDWQNAGITDEANLNVYFYRDGLWSPLFPCDGCSRDMDKNEFTLKLDHLTEFAVAGAKFRVILPNIRK
jgi:subtilisin family serine protease